MSKSHLYRFLRAIFPAEQIEEVVFYKKHPFFICWDSLFTFPVLEVRQDSLVLDTLDGTIFLRPSDEGYSFAFLNPEE